MNARCCCPGHRGQRVNPAPLGRVAAETTQGSAPQSAHLLPAGSEPLWGVPWGHLGLGQNQQGQKLLFPSGCCCSGRRLTWRSTRGGGVRRRRWAPCPPDAPALVPLSCPPLGPAQVQVPTSPQTPAHLPCTPASTVPLHPLPGCRQVLEPNLGQEVSV